MLLLMTTKSAWSGSYTLTKDIDMSVVSGQTPIGDGTDNFTGTFDGAGYTVSGLNISSTAQYTGLFGYIKGATVKNLTIDGSISSTARYTGGLVGYANASNIENCQNKATVSGTGYVGGLVGYNMGVIEDCYTRGTVTATSAYITHVGGLVGYNEGTVKDSFSTATVSGTSTDFIAYAGGVVGYHKSGTVSGCFATGNVTAKGTSDAYSRNGGFAGFVSDDAVIEDCYRKNGQRLTQNTTVGSAYCESATEATLSEIMTYCESNWSNSIWNFDYSVPTF
jgi:hypothetical protein